MAKLLMILIALVLLINLTLSLPSHSEKHEKHSKREKHDKHEKRSSKSKEHHDRHSKHDKSEKTFENQIDDNDDDGWEYENTTKVDTRRILYSKTTQKGKRPYMVYLQLTKESAKAHKYRGWLCGGVIVERYYVLTSAACVEDADHFYVVSGTTKFVDSFDYKSNECVCKHRRKVVWKCIPKNYKFDFQDSIKWSSNDIAIVKVDKPFKFGVCEKGCDFATDLVCYNNVSRDLEKPGTKGHILGWGSGSNFREGVYRRQKTYTTENAKCLQEARVCIMDNEQCAKKWSQRFRNIITQYMICTKDVMKRLSEICDKRYANCTDVENRRHLELDGSTELQSSNSFNVDLGRHLRDPDDYTARRSNQGGFCENDHGGPLVVKYQSKDRVIGVISACKIDPKSHSCHGPFLYTSVFKNRQFISCSIYKDVEESCRRVFRSGITHEEWSVDWDNVKEDDKADDQDDERDEARADSGSDGDNDSNKDESKEALRVKVDKGDKKVKEDDKSKAPKKADTSSSESSSESEEKSKHDKSKDEKRKEKPKKKKSKAKSEDKKHTRTQKKEKPTKRSKKSKDSSGEPRVRSQDRKELFYESSRDENVNEPDDEE